VAGLSFERDSWVTPVDARRVRPEEDTGDVAAEQVRALIRGRPAPDTAPLFVFAEQATIRCVYSFEA
jgi:hypothetical protein